MPRWKEFSVDARRVFGSDRLDTPSPSGYEQPRAAARARLFSGVADTITTDSHGNVIAANPGGHTRMLLAGHCDQIGLIVQYIDSDGYISVQPIGGWDPMQLVGARVTIWTATGSCAGRDVAEADPSADRRGAEAGAQDEGPLDRHRPPATRPTARAWSASVIP